MMILSKETLKGIYNCRLMILSSFHKPSFKPRCHKGETMNLFIRRSLFVSFVLFLTVLLSTGMALSKTVTQLVPVLSVSEEYSDNLLQDSSNEQEEYITSYKLGFSLGFLNKKSKIYLNYEPEYKDYKELDDRDRFQHNVGIDAVFQPTKFTEIKSGIIYTGQSDDYEGEPRRHSADIAGKTQISKNSTFIYSESYTRSFEQQARTGDYEEHDVNKTKIGLKNKYGKKSSYGLNLAYEFDDYKTADDDEYTKLRPSAILTHWIGNTNGIELSAGFENTDFENSNNDVKNYNGHIRYIRSFTKHLDGYLKYRHSYSDRENNDHHVFHPSLGIDWDITEDSGISLGLGALISEWEGGSNSDSVDPFVDIDAYKIFNFSRKGRFVITGSSGYSDSGSDAASLGYSTYYQAGFRLNYQPHKRVETGLSGYYKLDEFHEDAVNRTDSRYNISGNISWLALKWLRFNLTCAHTAFDSDSADRDDYNENTVFLSVNLIPQKPIKIDMGESRKYFEKEIFNN